MRFKVYTLTKILYLKFSPPTNVPNILYNIHMKYYHYYYYMIDRRSARMMNFSRNFKKKNFDQSVNRIAIKLRPVAIFRRAKIGPAAEYFQQNVSAYYQNWSSHGRITRSPIPCTMECTMSHVSARLRQVGKTIGHRIALFDNGGFP